MKDTYENPLITRYASPQMAQLFSDDKKFRTWRRLWTALAQSETGAGAAHHGCADRSRCRRMRTISTMKRLRRAKRRFGTT